MRYNFNDPQIKLFRQRLRNNPTFGEIKLWRHLKNKNFFGYKFRRQYSINKYIVDFYCPKLRLAIEIDGPSHDEYKYLYDQQRQKEIEEYNVSFLRFTKSEVLGQIDNVLITIQNFIDEIETTTPAFGHPS